MGVMMMILVEDVEGFTIQLDADKQQYTIIFK